ncbi:MAG: leucine-rich repeat protein [Candidatus Ventricola sp.]
MRSIAKRTAAAVLAAAALAFAALPGLAEELTVAAANGGQTVESTALSGQCGEGLYYEFDAATGTLIISGTGSMWDFAGQAPWAPWQASIRKIVISTGVTRVSSDAFKGCAALEAVELPGTLTAIDAGAFSGCESLKEVDLSATAVAIIGESAFDGCSQLETLSFPATLATINAGAFSGCESLKEVDLSATAVETIGAAAFDGCTSLETVVLPDTVVSIAADVFSGCGSLSAIVAPEAVVSIALSDVELPEAAVIQTVSYGESELPASGTAGSASGSTQSSGSAAAPSSTPKPAQEPEEQHEAGTFTLFEYTTRRVQTWELVNGRVVLTHEKILDLESTGNYLQIVDYTYDEQGNMARLVSRWPTEHETEVVDYTYDASGNLIKEVRDYSYNDQKELYTVDYTYENGLLVKESYVRWVEGEISDWYDCSYITIDESETGKTIETRYFAETAEGDSWFQIIRSTFDERGYVLKQLCYDDNEDTPSGMSVYEYADDGTETETYTSLNGSQRLVSVRDANGLLLREENSYKGGSYVRVYTYYENGLLKSCTQEKISADETAQNNKTTVVYELAEDGMTGRQIMTSGSWSQTSEWSRTDTQFVTKTYENGALASTTVILYSADGVPVSKETTSSGDGRTLISYNSQGRVQERVRYDADGSLAERIVYDYDGQGRVLTENQYHADGLFQTITYGYHGTTFMQAYRCTVCGGIKTEVYYDLNGRQTQRITYDESGALTDRSVTEYDELGRVLSHITYDGSGSICYSEIMEYKGDSWEAWHVITQYPDGYRIERTVFDDGSYVNVQTNPDGYRWESTCDALGRQTEYKTFNQDGTLIYWETDEYKGSSPEYWHSIIVFEDGSRTEWTKLDDGSSINITENPDGSSWKHTYDALDRILESNGYGADGTLLTMMTYEYKGDSTEPWHTLIVYDEGGYEETTTFDDGSTLYAQIDMNGAGWETTSDALGRPTEVKSYDAGYKLVSTSTSEYKDDSAEPWHSFAVYADGRTTDWKKLEDGTTVDTQTNADGSGWSFSYDALGRNTLLQYFDENGELTSSTTYDYEGESSEYSHSKTEYEGGYNEFTKHEDGSTENVTVSLDENGNIAQQTISKTLSNDEIIQDTTTYTDGQATSYYHSDSSGSYSYSYNSTTNSYDYYAEGIYSSEENKGSNPLPELESTSDQTDELELMFVPSHTPTSTPTDESTDGSTNGSTDGSTDKPTAPIEATPGEAESEANPSDESGDEPDDESGDEPDDESGDESGNEPADESGDEPDDESGDEPADGSGDESDDESGDEPDDESGDEPDDESGDESGDEPADESSDEPDDESGDELDDESGDEPDDESGDEPDDESGDEPDDESGDEPDDESGDEPDDESGDEPDDESGDEPDDSSGDEPDDESGDEPDDESGDEPDDESGDEPDDESGDEPDDGSDDEPGEATPSEANA